MIKSMSVVLRLSMMFMALFYVALIPRYALSQDATAYQINPAHNGRITFKEPFTAPLKWLWRRRFGPNYVGFPLIANNMAFVTITKYPVTVKDSATTDLYALDLRTGATRWHRTVHRFAVNDTLAAASTYANGRVFVLTGDCNLTAVSADSVGTVLWRMALPSEYYECDTSPIAYAGRVYVAGAGTGGIAAAVDQESGVVDWRRKVLTGDGSSPTEGDDSIFLSYPCQTYKLSDARGTSKWPVNTGCVGGGGMTADYFSGRLFAMGGYLQKNKELDAVTEQLIRHVPEAGWLPVFWQKPNGSFLQIQWEGKGLYAHDVKTYKTVWFYPCCVSFDFAPTIAPIVVNNYVIYGDGEGNIYLLDAATGKLVWSKQASQYPIESDQGGVPRTASLAAANGVLLVPADTELIAFGN